MDKQEDPIAQAIEDIKFQLVEFGIDGEYGLISINNLAKQRIDNQAIHRQIEQLKTTYQRKLRISLDTMYTLETLYFQGEFSQAEELSRKSFSTSEQRQASLEYLQQLSSLLSQLY